MKCGAVALTALVSCSMSLGCASDTHTTKTRRTATSAVLPPVVMARPFYGDRMGSPFLPRGTVVPSKDLGERVFVDAKRGFALANMPQKTYPAATTNGGKVWHIDGPLFHVAAAQAPLAVTVVGAVPPDTYFAYGGGDVIDISTDGGAHWWIAWLTALAVAPGQQPHELFAVALRSVNGNLRVYRSTDGGRRWYLTHSYIY